jgi:predicted nucleic acid-binding protein
VRLFLGANVLFAAVHSPEGRSRALFELATGRHCSLLTSPHAVDEARRNLTLKSPSQADSLDDLLSVVEQVAEAGPRFVAWAASHGLPPNDAPILAAAAAANADALVTGDRAHFGHLFGEKPGGVEILPLSDALARVLDARLG